MNMGLPDDCACSLQRGRGCWWLGSYLRPQEVKAGSIPAGPSAQRQTRNRSRNMNDKCLLEERGACCCTCRNHVQDFHHCTTSPAEVAEFGKCVCSRPKGWICNPPEMEAAYSGWSEHGMCEMHTPKQVRRSPSQETE